VTRRSFVVVGLAVALIAFAAAAAAVFAGTTSTGHARDPTIKERAGITAGLPKSLQRDPVGCIYLPIRVSSDGRFARAGVDFLNWKHGPCARYPFNGPDWILRKPGPRWKIIAYTSGSAASPRCSLGIPSYLLVKPCRR
jgi:hypothetical protein